MTLPSFVPFHHSRFLPVDAGSVAVAALPVDNIWKQILKSENDKGSKTRRILILQHEQKNEQLAQINEGLEWHPKIEEELIRLKLVKSASQVPSTGSAAIGRRCPSRSES